MSSELRVGGVDGWRLPSADRFCGSRREGLKAPQQQPTRVRLCLSDESSNPLRPLRRDHVWRCSFVMVNSTDGRTVRILVIIDEFTQECLKMVVARSLGSRDALEALWGLFVARGIPEYIRPDNGPEFAVKAVWQLLARVGIKTLFIEPESPWENGHDKSFVGKMRDELLDGEIFEISQEAEGLMGRGEYDELRPHCSRGYASPAPEGGMPEARSTPTLGLVQSLGAGHLDSRSQDAPFGGDGSHEVPRADGEEAVGLVPPAHRETPHEGTVVPQERQLNDLPGIRQGSAEEIELLHRGAEKDLSGFQLELGERYTKGVKGAPKNYAEARKWLTRAFQDPEFPEHKDQAAALLDELKNAMRADSGKATSRVPSAATVHLGSLKTWQIFAAIAAVAIAVLLLMNR